ncbi:MAG: TniQ family protein [Patescibacteria group bacterium]|nr:TniQ family protein [Patescibacteria group bacterium]
MGDVPIFGIEEFPSWVENPIWLWKVDPFDGESLTSWIARLSAKMQIEMPKLLNGFQLSETEAMADLDVNPPMGLVKELVRRTGKSEETIMGMTLSAILPGARHEKNRTALNLVEMERYIFPWITQGGLLRGKRPVRKKGRTSYCQRCLDDGATPFIPVENRLSTTVVCPKHLIPLMENCPYCGTFTYTSALSILSGLSKDGHPLCWSCAYVPNRGGSTNNPYLVQNPLWSETDSLLPVLSIQQQVLGALSAGMVDLPQIGRISSVRYFQGLKVAVPVLLSLIKKGIDPRSNGLARWPPVKKCCLPHWWYRNFNEYPLCIRLKIIAYVAWLIERPLDRWQQLYPVYFLSPQLPLHWSHPWEVFGEDGMEIIEDIPAPKDRISRSQGSRDVFRAFFAVAEQVGLGQTEIAKLMGNLNARTIRRWSDQTPFFVRNEHLQKMHNLVRIWSRTKDRNVDLDTARAWLRKTIQHPVFPKRSPLEVLFESDKPREFEMLETFFDQLW